MHAKGFDVPLPVVQAAPGKGGLKQHMRFDLPRQPHLDPDDQPDISDSIRVSDIPASAKKVLEKVYGNINRRFVHLETWVRISLNEMLSHFESNGDDHVTVQKCMEVIRLALRQYRQTALAEIQVALGVIDAPTAAHQVGVPLVSVTSAVAAAQQRSSSERSRKHLEDGSPSKRAKTDDEAGSTSRGSDGTDTSPASGARGAGSTRGHSGSSGSGAKGDAAFSKN
jgi:hypothetical protein